MIAQYYSLTCIVVFNKPHFASIASLIPSKSMQQTLLSVQLYFLASLIVCIFQIFLYKL